MASCFLGAFPPVDFLAVCLVRAIRDEDIKDFSEEREFDLANASEYRKYGGIEIGFGVS